MTTYLTYCDHAATMDSESMKAFITNAEAELASVRRSLLLFSQAAEYPDLSATRTSLEVLCGQIPAFFPPASSPISARCRTLLSIVANQSGLTIESANRALDLVAEVEEAILKSSMGASDFIPDISWFVDSQFESILASPADSSLDQINQDPFAIDDETIAVFRTEAEELLERIESSVRVLGSSPADQIALWEIRKNAHTLKGSAGIVGLSSISVTAHMIEDILDRLVHNGRAATAQVTAYLEASLRAIYSNLSDDPSMTGKSELAGDFDLACESLDRSLRESDTTSESTSVSDGSTRGVLSARSSIVRVSISILDELLLVSERLAQNQARFADVRSVIGSGQEARSIIEINAISDEQTALVSELRRQLLNIRMVRFGTLETRLRRAVNFTSFDEKKKADIEIADPDVEIDTCIIDALIEPLLHLLKNAVVHGIEPPETRRLIGKPAAGKIKISVAVDDATLVLTVADDGFGISIPRLRETAVAAGVRNISEIAAMSDREIAKLIFERGLTTAEKVDLNSGRGIGMNIAKESIDNLGGSIFVESQPHKGTTFTIVVPLLPFDSRIDTENIDPVQIPEPCPSMSPLVLVVDDSASIRRHLSKIIIETGSRVITANNGADALELLLNGAYEPDLIFSDVEMPQIDGWEFLEYVKTDANFGNIPMILITSLDQEDLKGRAFALGASDVIIKPYSGSDIERALSTFCMRAVV